MDFKYGIDHFTVKKAIGICRGDSRGVLTAEAINQINQSRRMVDQMIDAKKTVYGVNTGFGPLCDTLISSIDTNVLQKNLLISHAVGVGDPISKELSKLMMICKVHALAQGYSGIRLAVVQRIIFFIDKDLIPVVPEKGSVGASGDLAPLSHLFLPLIGLGEFWKNGKIVDASSVYQEHKIEPISLEAKEGLALINGTQFILAHAILGLDKMAYLLDLADLSGAMSVEGFQGSAAPFMAELHAIRPFKGSITVAKRMRALLDDSQNLQSHVWCDRVQDPYSLRCIPQVHGASRNAYDHLNDLVEIEMNSVTDNPIILSATTAISGGNFHGQPLAMALDYATIAASELGNIADRRCYLLLEGRYGLPRMLTENPGLNSGLMILQYTTAALVTENKSLCFPPSADSVPTSLGQEDHVSMGSISGRKFNQVLKNIDMILAIELLCAAEAIEYRRPLTCSSLIETNHALVRTNVDKLEGDRMIKNDIDTMIALVRERAFVIKI